MLKLYRDGTEMKTIDYAKDLRAAINFKDYSSLVFNLGTQLNDRKDRFDKSDIIEQSIEVYSDDRLKYVDGIGRDHTDKDTGLDLEFKYAADSMFTKKGKAPKKVVKVKLKNSLGKNKGTEISDPADYYMIGQQDAIAIISFEEVKPFLIGVPDGIEAHIPFDELTFVFTPSDIIETPAIELDYKTVKLAAQRKIIEDARL